MYVEDGSQHPVFSSIEPTFCGETGTLIETQNLPSWLHCLASKRWGPPVSIFSALGLDTQASSACVCVCTRTAAQALVLMLIQQACCQLIHPPTPDCLTHYCHPSIQLSAHQAIGAQKLCVSKSHALLCFWKGLGSSLWKRRNRSLKR